MYKQILVGEGVVSLPSIQVKLIYLAFGEFVYRTSKCSSLQG